MAGSIIRNAVIGRRWKFRQGVWPAVGSTIKKPAEGFDQVAASHLHAAKAHHCKMAIVMGRLFHKLADPRTNFVKEIFLWSKDGVPIVLEDHPAMRHLWGLPVISALVSSLALMPCQACWTLWQPLQIGMTRLFWRWGWRKQHQWVSESLHEFFRWGSHSYWLCYVCIWQHISRCPFPVEADHLLRKGLQLQERRLSKTSSHHQEGPWQFQGFSQPCVLASVWQA